MSEIIKHWDYLIITGSNEVQAQSYEMQLRLRQELGLLESVREVLVVPDPGGKRIGSGGSTLHCLIKVLNCELRQNSRRLHIEAWQNILKDLRILIVHGGGDSRRLPAYGPCGKIFIPVPGESDSCLPLTLFDRQLPTYLKLPAPSAGVGQIVITSGDVLLCFDPAKARFFEKGLTGLGCYATPEQAKNHGVFCRDEADQVRLFLQKPSPAEQQAIGAIDAYGQALLDIGVMNLDAHTAAMLLRIFGTQPGDNGRLQLEGEMSEAVLEYGLDFYREICCGLGSDANLTRYINTVRESGSTWKKQMLERLFESLSSIPFYVNVLPQCEFLNFGTSRQIISSGNLLMQKDLGSNSQNTFLNINNEIPESGQIVGTNAWVEGCRVNSTLTLEGENVIVGVDINEPLSLPPQMCLDIVPGRDHNGKPIWFVRCYNVYDTFSSSIDQEATCCGIPILEWLELVGAQPEDIWDFHVPPEQRSLWNARIFPAIPKHHQYSDWLWLFDLAKAGPKEYQAWRSADRYSSAEIAALADQEAFYRRRSLIRADEIQKSLRKMFRGDSEFSAGELIHILKIDGKQSTWISNLIAEARRCHNRNNGKSLDSMVFPRIIHTLGSALSELSSDGDVPVEEVLPGLSEKLTGAEHDWLDSIGLRLDSPTMLRQWTQRAHSLAFDFFLGQAIISNDGDKTPPRRVLRSDEIVYGRAPLSIDTNGWTEILPYSLENGGCVIDIAINLNGQPPIQAYMRVIDELVIRLGSIDLGTRVEVNSLDELLDYRQASSEHALAKAALALSGFSPETANWPKGTTLKQMLEQFGGGIELTTLAAIPKGSGLGTSSIMGAVILAVIQRVIGQTLTQKELFHAVLRLEQSLTIGGGWQDQIGGAVGGAKIVTTEPGLVPDAKIRYLPADVLDPKVNNGQTLLYYTGITRLAKDILGQVVGRYLDRDRKTLSTLRQIHALAPQVAEALSRKDIRAFGQLVDAAWQLNKQLDPSSTNDEIEALLLRVQPYIFGAKLLGAGGGGFLLMVCKSAEDAEHVRIMLEAEPANERARFFDYDINPEGLVVTVC